MSEPPFSAKYATFFQDLHNHGFRLGVEQFLRIEQVFQRLGDDAPEILGDYLCPLIARSPEEQQRFFRLWNEHVSGSNATVPPPEMTGRGPVEEDEQSTKRAVIIQDTEVGSLPQKSPVWSRLDFWLILVSGFLVIYITNHILPTTLPVRSVSPTATPRVTVSTGPQPTISPSVNLIVSPSPLTTSTPSSPSEKPSALPSHTSTPPQTVRPPANRQPTLRDWLTRGIYLVPVGVVFSLFLWLWWSLAQHSYRQILQQRKLPPYLLSFAVSPATRKQWQRMIYLPPQRHQVQESLSYHRTEETFDWNEEETVDATAHRFGYMTPVFQQRELAEDYLILVEQQHWSDSEAFRFIQLFSQLEINDGDRRLLIFRDGPFLFSTVDRLSGQVVSNQFDLETLARKYGTYRLIVVGTGSGFYDPYFEQPAVGLDIFARHPDRWPTRLFLSTVPHEQWSAREVVLSQMFDVLPATTEALADWLCYQNQPTRNNYSKMVRHLATFTEISTDAIEPTELTADQLQQQLSESGFIHLMACAVPTRLDFDLAMQIGHRLVNKGTILPEALQETQLARLLQLPFFAKGRIPVELRTALLARLNRRPSLSQEVRQNFLQILEENKPPENSFAYSEYLINKIVQEDYLSVVGFRKSLASFLNHFVARDALTEAPLYQILQRRDTAFYPEFIRRCFRYGLPSLGLRYLDPRSLRIGLPLFSVLSSLLLVVLSFDLVPLSQPTSSPTPESQPQATPTVETTPLVTYGATTLPPKVKGPERPAIANTTLGVAGMKIAQKEAEANVAEQPSGSLSGPRVDVYQRSVGVQKREWCLAFVYWCIGEAIRQQGGNAVSQHPLPRTNSTNSLQDWAEKQGKLLPVGTPAMPGDIILYRDRTKRRAAFVVNAPPAGSNLFQLVEGHTHLIEKPNQEGTGTVGVYQHNRQIVETYRLLRLPGLSSTTTNPPTKQPVIFLRAGHETPAGSSESIKTPYGDEQVWANEIVDTATKRLQAYGITVRRDLAGKDIPCDIAVAVHFNADDQDASSRGLETYIESNTSRSRDMAQRWNRYVKATIGYPGPDRGVKLNGDRSAGQLRFFKQVAAKQGVMAPELAFITNKQDADWYRPNLKAVGEYLATFLGTELGIVIPPPAAIQPPPPRPSTISPTADSRQQISTQ